jgi:uracil phosphoribosyltransferase
MFTSLPFNKQILKYSKPILGLLAISFSKFTWSNKFFSSKRIFALSKGDLPQDGKIPEFFEELDIDELNRRYPNLTVIKSKAVDVLLGKLRDVNVSREQFRFLSRRIIRYIIEEALASECNKEVIRKSPLGYYKAMENERDIKDYVAVSILRSGNGMLDEVMNVCPDLVIGKILIQRDESSVDKRPIFFFEKLPKNLDSKRILILDPMLGTGGSVNACIKVLKEKGVKEENILFLNLISCEDGLKSVFSHYPNIKVITAKVDFKLLPNKYIAPGIGDFGDRYYGTEH